MSREEGQGPGRRASKRTHTFSIFLDGDKVEEIHQHPDTTLSPLTVLHKLVPTQGLPQRNHLIPQPAVDSGPH